MLIGVKSQVKNPLGIAAPGRGPVPGCNEPPLRWEPKAEWRPELMGHRRGDFLVQRPSSRITSWLLQNPNPHDELKESGPRGRDCQRSGRTRSRYFSAWKRLPETIPTIFKSSWLWAILSSIW